MSYIYSILEFLKFQKFHGGLEEGREEEGKKLLLEALSKLVLKNYFLVVLYSIFKHFHYVHFCFIWCILNSECYCI